MGAYEFTGGGPLDVVFEANRVNGFTPQPVIFTATVWGDVTDDLGFTWDFKDGTILTGPDLFVVTNDFLAGDYTPTLTVTNGAGESVTKSLVNPAEVIRISSYNVYVRPGQLNQAPYDTWEKAAASIQTAVNYGHAENGTGTVVWVDDGTYTLTANVTVTKMDTGCRQ